MKNLMYHMTPAGLVGIAETGEAVTDLFFAGRVLPGAREEESPLLRRAVRQLDEYFAGARKRFDLPLAPVGTAFQQAVWRALQKIPYGETRSYKEVGKAVGRPAAFRAVGMANNKNPIAIIIPCHRVLGADGSLTGYAGGLDAKRRLLALETRFA